LENDSYLEEILKSLTQYIKPKIGADAFRDWFSKVYVSYDNGYYLNFPNEFAKNWVSKNYSHYITAFGDEIGIEIKINNNINTNNKKEVIEKEKNTFDSKHSFENFMVAKSNEMAYEAALQVAKSNEIIFNPLFIYGNVGLGKTHLMKSIALYKSQHFPKQKTLYLSAEEFMNKFVRAIQNRTVMNFKDEFRSVDLLMIDDFQFLCTGNKESTRGEFFFTFNTLLELKKQLVISADQPPSSLPGIEERLKSRLGWGLPVDIHPATYELKLGILQNKTKSLNLEINDEVLDYIATKVTNSIRELEGAFTRIIKYAEWLKQPINLELAQRMLQDMNQNTSTTPENILEKICKILDVNISDIKSNSRKREIVRARQKAVYILRNNCHLSYMQIAKTLGNKDHSSIMYAETQAKKFKESDANCANDLQKLNNIS